MQKIASPYRVKKTPVYNANLFAYESGKYRLIANEGSTRSSKTVSISQLLSIHIPAHYTKSITIVSPSLPHLKRGARREVLKYLQKSGIYNDGDFNKTDNIYNYPNGSYIEFFGVEDSNKVHGPGRDILWVNEANLISYDTYKQLAIRTNEIIFLDYNPAEEFSWCYSEADKAGSKVIHSTYKNNLGNLTSEIVGEIESLKDADENLWRVYGLGLRGTSSETIYTHWKLCDNLPNRGEQWYGQDFGYNVESALVIVEFYEGAIYVQELIYETKLTTTDLIERYKILGIDRRKEIFCDAAEPKAIEEIRRAGYNALAADKDVTEGIRNVKSRPLYITRDSTDLIKEIKSYKYMKKGELVTDDPVKFRDHLCFVGETLITTDKGMKQIKDIEIGDTVLTSNGYRKVVNVFDNGCNEILTYWFYFTNFIVKISATPNHLIKTKTGWKQIHTLTKGDVLFTHKPSTTSYTGSTLKNAISNSIFLICTLMFGRQLTARFLMDFMFIIKKVYLQMTLMIWNYCRDINIWLCICKKELRKILNGLIAFSKWVLKLHLNGTAAKLAGNGIGNMPEPTRIMFTTETLPPFALYATQPLKHQLLMSALIGFAPTTVKASGEGMQDLTMLKPNVNIADYHLLKTNTTNLPAVQEAAVKNIVVSKKEIRQVYDIEVEDMHEYFANGILVSNCDSLRYAIFTKLSKPKRIVLI